MTAEPTNLAAWLVTHERFPRPGSVAWGDMRWEREAPDWVLDLRSMRTAGVLLGLLGAALYSVQFSEADGWTVLIFLGNTVGGFGGATLAEACARALLALWEVS